MAEKTKAELLKEYERKPVTSYVQLDAFVGQEYHGPDDDSMDAPDADGDDLWCSKTEELMRFDDGVRVLVAERATAEDAARTLRKMADWVEDGALDDIREDDPYFLLGIGKRIVKRGTPR